MHTNRYYHKQQSAHFLVKRDLTNGSSHVSTFLSNLVELPWYQKYITERIDTDTICFVWRHQQRFYGINKGYGSSDVSDIRLIKKHGQCFWMAVNTIIVPYLANYYDEWRNARQDVDVYISILHFSATLIAEASPRPSVKPASIQESSLVCLLSLK